jgi:hypothetical protein
MSFVIPLNRSNLVQNGFNNTYEFSFRGSAANFTDCEVAIHSISMYNSIFNIDSSSYQNNMLTIAMPTGSTTSVLSITIPDGLYSYENLSAYIQSQFVTAGAYLIDQNGLYVHYAKLSSNATYYACQLDLSPVPTSLPSGWTRPATGLYSSGGSGFPTTTRVPIVNVTSDAFGSVLGFAAGSYPASAQTTLQSFLSNVTPTIHPVSSYLVRCNLVVNPFTMPSDILGSFDKQGTSAGELINYKPSELLWLPVSDGSYSNIRITIVDQLERFVRIRDPDLSILLVLKQSKK